MITCLTDENLSEMMMEILEPSFSKGCGLEESRFMVDSRYAKVTFAEIRTPAFSIVDVHFRSLEDLKLYLRVKESDVLSFCAILQGNIACIYEPLTDKFTWRNGYANLHSHNNVEGYMNFCHEEPFRMVEIMLSHEYLTGITATSPSLLNEMLAGNTSHPLFRTFSGNIPFCSAIGEALNNILHYQWTGNVASMYLDAKIREILSLFLCRRENDCSRSCCNGYSSRDNDKFICAKEILEQRYQNPPSLRELSLMVVTNECTLKNGFKALFGTTVFGYLFDYRMKLATQYLLDTNKTVQEIANLVGYEHHSHFSTAFKRKFGVSPRQYQLKGSTDSSGYKVKLFR